MTSQGIFHSLFMHNYNQYHTCIKTASIHVRHVYKTIYTPFYLESSHQCITILTIQTMTSCMTIKTTSHALDNKWSLMCITMHNQPYTHEDILHENAFNLHMVTSLQAWSTPCNYNKHMDYMNKEHIWNQHESMINTQPKESTSTLSYHSVTSSYHIYPSNHLDKVNMWWEDTMIWFNLIGNLKEMESTETHHTDLPQVLQDPRS